MTLVRISPSGRSIDLEAGDAQTGLQTAWAIDPVNGSDDPEQPGTPARPLATMREFNDRMRGALLTVPATLQLVGNVIDSPLWLRYTTFDTAGSLVVSGTVTTLLTTATVTVVASLNTAGAQQPWQLTTTGINWTVVPIGSRLSFSNGTFAFIRNVIDANNVAVGPLSAFTGSVSVTPTAGLTIVVQALSRALMPTFVIVTAKTGATVTMQHLSFDAGNFTSALPATFQIQGCELNFANNQVISCSGDLCTFRTCRITHVTTVIARNVFGRAAFTSCVFSCATSGGVQVDRTGGLVVFTQCCLFQATLTLQFGGYVFLAQSFNISHTTTAVNVQSGGTLNCSTCILSGSAGAGVGIAVDAGWVYWTGLANRPTLTGGAGDCTVAGVTYTYAALGQGKTAAFDSTLAPVTNTFVGRGPGVATFSENG